MYNPQRYDCRIKYQLDHTDFIKGPMVDLKLISFYTKNLEDGIPFYWFYILSGNKEVGKISLRIGYNDTTLANGHIGYEIYPDYQGHQYSYYALEMIKGLAYRHGFHYVIISTTIDNLSSQKIIEKAGGKMIIESYELPKDHIFFVIGKEVMHIYEIEIKPTYENI
jgi:RimJ/RimL family protein N-acetyltransferase